MPSFPLHQPVSNISQENAKNSPLTTCHKPDKSKKNNSCQKFSLFESFMTLKGLTFSVIKKNSTIVTLKTKNLLL